MNSPMQTTISIKGKKRYNLIGNKLVTNKLSGLCCTRTSNFQIYQEASTQEQGTQSTFSSKQFFTSGGNEIRWGPIQPRVVVSKPRLDSESNSEIDGKSYIPYGGLKLQIARTAAVKCSSILALASSSEPP